MQMKSKIWKVINNNIYMLGLAWKQKKAYFCVFILIILITNIKDLVLVVASKYIFDSLQFGESFKAILLPVLIYVALYFLLHVTLHALSYMKTVFETKLKMDLNVSLGEKFMKVDHCFLENNSSIDMFNRAKIAISGGLSDIQTLGLGGEQGLTGYFDQLLKVLCCCVVFFTFSVTWKYLCSSSLLVVSYLILFSVLYR